MKYSKVEITCKVCGISFKVFNYRKDSAKFCSMKCNGVALLGKQKGVKSAVWSQTLAECHMCGVEFGVQKHREGTAKFCSQECYWDSLKTTGGEGHPNRKRVKRLCIYCDAEFETVPSSSKEYCSHQCYLDNIEAPTVEKVCLFCEKKFDIKEYDSTHNKIYCSHSCFTKSNRTNRYKDHAGGLATNWRRQILIRDENTCVECGAENEGNKKHFLHAHHIKSWKDFPDLRFELHNGVTLCVFCHSKKHPYLANTILNRYNYFNEPVGGET